MSYGYLKRFKINVGFVLLSCLFFPLKSISNKHAKIGSILGGSITGSCVAISVFNLGFNSKNNQILRCGSTALLGSVAGVIVGYISYKWLLKKTPNEHLIVAQKIVQKITSDPFISIQFETTDELVAYIDQRFSTNWPLKVALEYLKAAADCLLIAQDLINIVQKEARSEANYDSICFRCKQLNQQLVQAFKIIESHLSEIIKKSEYCVQISLYAKHQEVERQRKSEILAINNNFESYNIKNSKRFQLKAQILQVFA